MNLPDTVAVLIEKGASQDLKNHEGQTPLDLAKFQGTREKLLNLGTHPQVSEAASLDEHLYTAVSNGDPIQAERLLKTGANANAFDNIESDSAVVAAIKNSDTEMVELLLAYGADVSQATNKGVTPLIKLVQENKWSALRMAKILLDAGADPNLQDSLGMSALQYAQNSDMRQLLIEKGANTTLQGS